MRRRSTTACQVHALRAGEAPPTALRDGLAVLAEQGFNPITWSCVAPRISTIAPDTQEAILLVAAHLGTTR